jgi:hypothetical protein
MLERLVLPARALSSGMGPLPSPEEIAADHPAVTLVFGDAAPGRPTVSLGVSAWTSFRFDVYATDARLRRLADEGPVDLKIDGPADACMAVAEEVLTRFQRFAPRRNRASEGPAFDRLLAHHRAMHAMDKPLVRADFEHAIDAWQWTLRLDPAASLEAQAAALLHDVERLSSEADARVEHLAPDHDAFKDDHARRGGALARAAILAAGLGERVADRVAALVERHERVDPDAEGTLVREADALSFFSLNSYGFFDYFGPDHTRRKVAYTIRRMRPATRARLRRIRCRPEVGALVQAYLGAAEGGG